MAEPIQLIRSREELNKRRGGRDGLYGLFEGLTWDNVHFFDDFLGDKIQGSETGGATQASGIYEINTGVDGALNILANQPNGVAELRASDGAGANDEYCGLSLPELAFTGDRNAVIAVRLAIDTLTTVKVEMGFADVTTDNGVINDKTAIPPTGAGGNNDAAVWILDTDDNGNWEGVGMQAGTGVREAAGISPTAGTFETLIVALRDTNVKYLRLDASGGLTFESNWQTSGITAATALVPWVFVQVRDAVDRNVQIDFIDVRARRTT